MDHILSKYCPRIEFDSYEEFLSDFKIEVPENFNFAYDVVDEWARVEPDKKALVWCDDNDNEKILTFTEISLLSNKAANALSELGIKKGDIVLVMLRQRWEYWVCATALCKIGAIIIPATTQLTKKDLVYRLNSSGAKALITWDDSYVNEQVLAAEPDCPKLEYKIQVGEISSTTTTEHWTSFEALMEFASEDWQRPTGEAATSNQDIMLIYFTSGTTGLAKMCAHNFVHPLGHIITAKYWQQVEEDQLHCSVSDSGWAKFGWGKIYGQWLSGAAVFAYDNFKFDPKKLLEKIAKYRVRTFCVPPTMYRFMLQEDVSAFDLSCVQNFTTAGEPLNADVTNRWFAATGKMIREGFGQTEGPVLVATFPWVTPRPGSMGKPSPLLNIQLLDAGGEQVEDGEEGNICVTGLKTAYPPGLFIGYYRNSEATKEAVGGEYYNLSDVAWRDPDGYYTFVGRSDDVIKCSGYRIGPFEVESALVAHPLVIECAVTAVPDEVRGNVVKATIVLVPGTERTEALVKELQNHVKETTAPYKYPRIVEFVDELPKTIGGKIKRAQIRATDKGDEWDG